MPKEKVLILDPIREEGLKILKKEGLAVEKAGTTDLDNNMEPLTDTVAIIVRTSRVSKEIISSATDLKVIGKHGVGIDNIDIDTATRKGVLVVNTPKANIQSVVEYTFTLMFNLLKKVIPADKAFRDHKWLKEEMVGLEIKGKTLGLIGLGKIGTRVGNIADEAFGMKVIGYDPYLSWKNKKGIKRTEDLNELLAESDIVSVHCPLTDKTRGLIGEKELKLIGPDSFIINTARGGIIDEKALYRALKKEDLGGVALDVFSKEPPFPDFSLSEFDNVVLTPHLAGNSKEALIRMSISVSSQVLACLKGNEPSNLVNPEAWMES